MNSSDWASIAARAPEQSLLVGLRPLLMPSRLQDDTQKVMFGDGKWLQIPGGRRVFTRFSIIPRGDDVWLLSAGRHWNVDRPDPR